MSTGKKMARLIPEAPGDRKWKLIQEIRDAPSEHVAGVDNAVDTEHAESAAQRGLSATRGVADGALVLVPSDEGLEAGSGGETIAAGQDADLVRQPGSADAEDNSWLPEGTSPSDVLPDDTAGLDDASRSMRDVLLGLPQVRTSYYH
jgi:hypothetical protein